MSIVLVDSRDHDLRCAHHHLVVIRRQEILGSFDQQKKSSKAGIHIEFPDVYARITQLSRNEAIYDSCEDTDIRQYHQANGHPRGSF